MTLRLELHPTHPQARLMWQAAEQIRQGALAVLPTDASFVIACHLGDKAAAERLRALRGIDDKHLLTLICRDLSELATYAQVDNAQYRFLKAWTPGPYTFVLNATKEVPRRLAHPSRKTVGLRVPQHPVLLGILQALGEPILASTLKLPDEEDVLHDPDEIAVKLNKRVDVIVDAGMIGALPSTVIDMTGDAPVLQRAGVGAQAIAGAVIAGD